jgi:transcriptional regulator with XRE-family HTH domain
MQDGDLGVALAVLRLVRGWNQEELSRHSGVRSSSISDYERAKIVPGVATLRKLMGAMGYPFSAFDAAQALIANLRAESVLQAAAQLVEPGGPAETEADPEEGNTLLSRRLPDARRWEIEQAAIEVGRVATRITRLWFSLRETPIPERPSEAPPADAA